MALPGYPQTYSSPDLEIVTTESEDTQYTGPFSAIKVVSDANNEYAEIHVYLDQAGYDSDTTEGVDYYELRVLASDTITGPFYGFKFTTGGNAVGVIGYRYSTGI